MLEHGCTKLDTPLGNCLSFYIFCPLGAVEEGEKGGEYYQQHDGNPLSDDFGKHQSQVLALGTLGCFKCLETLIQRHPSMCVLMMLHPGLSPATSLGETEAGHWVAATPWLGIA